MVAGLASAQFDIYRVQNGQVSDNWHLEDNLSLMQQLGVVTP
jgi:hypothetical protein